MKQFPRNGQLRQGLLALCCGLVFPASGEFAAGQGYGLSAPVAVGKYLNGKLPSTTPTLAGAGAAPALLSQVQAFTSLASLTPRAGLIPYDINAPLWTDGAVKSRWLAIPNDGVADTAAEKITFFPTENWQFPRGAVLVKQFDLPVSDTNPALRKRLETRFLVKGEDDIFYGVTYRWRSDNSDADLVPFSGATETVSIATATGTRTQEWTYPGRVDCMACHNTNAGSVLGLRTHQLNRDLAYPGGATDNQLRTLNHLGFFSPALAESAISGFLKSARLTDSAASVETRARSYFSGNCAHCHRPGGITGAYFDARFEAPLAQQNLVNGPLLYDNGIAGARLVVPQSVPQSMVHVRLGSNGAERMPPVGRSVTDQAALDVLAQWIASLPVTPAGENTSPVARDDGIVMAFNSSVTTNVLSNDSDADGDALSLFTLGLAAHGLALKNADGTVTYTPNAGYSGADSFTYTARDARGLYSNEATVSVTVAPAASATSIAFTDRSSLVPAAVRSGVALVVCDLNGDRLDDIAHLHIGTTLKLEFQKPGGAAFGSLDLGSVGTNAQWGLCAGDIDNNGIADIATGGYYDGIKLFTGNATGTAWTKSTLANANLFTQAPGFADINNDGWLDLFACHDDGESLKFRNNKAGGLINDALLINTKTTPVSDNSGNYGIVWTDYDGDGDVDLYISKCRQGVNDPADPRRINKLLRNDGDTDGDGSINYTEAGPAAGLAIGDQSWAADFADIDNDGDLDCFVGNHFARSLLFRNNGNGTFTDITTAAGVNVNITVIQDIFRDFDNDGYIDLLVTGNAQVLLRNNGNSTFTEIPNPFVAKAMESAAVGDLNHDGFVDILAGYSNLYNTPSTYTDRIFMNNTNPNSWLAVDLRGRKSNRSAVGARLTLYGTWGKQVREVRAGEGYSSQNSLAAHFGLGNRQDIEKLVVRWPSGTVDTIQHPAANRYLFLAEGGSQPPVLTRPAAQQNLSGDTVSLALQASDPTGDALVFSALNLPPGLVLTPSTGLITGALTAASVGRYSVSISVTDGYSTVSDNFIWDVNAPSPFLAWQTATPGAGTTPQANGDGDLFDDVLEYALGGDPASGASPGVADALEIAGTGVSFSVRRPSGLGGVTWSVETSTDLATWTPRPQSPVITALAGNRESARWEGVGLTTTPGFVRLRVTLANPAATSTTLPLGWLSRALPAGALTPFGQPFRQSPLFSARVTAATGGTLTVAGTPAIPAGTPCFVEVIDGTFAGHRFDLASSSAGRLVLDAASLRNTSAAIPALAGARVVVCAHATLGGLFSPALFRGSTNVATADQLLFYENSGTGAEGYQTVFLLDGRPNSPVLYWRRASGASADQAGRIIAPGEGLLVKRPAGNPATAVLLTGQVRANPFAQPLKKGANLCAGSLPLARSPAGRGMTGAASGFTGSTNTAAADQIQLIQPAGGMQSLFLMQAPGVTPFWRFTSGASASQDASPIFQPAGCVFLRRASAPLPGFVVPAGWVP